MIQRIFLINFLSIVGIVLIVLYLLIILITFNPADPSWLQTVHTGPVCNFGGTTGAKISDFLLFFFGISAYMIPVFIILFFWKIYSSKIFSVAFFDIFFIFIKTFIFLIICCTSSNFFCKEWCYVSAGGVVGDILYNSLICMQYSRYDWMFVLLSFTGIISVVFYLHKFFALDFQNLLIYAKRRCLKYINSLFCENNKKKINMFILSIIVNVLEYIQQFFFIRNLILIMYTQQKIYQK